MNVPSLVDMLFWLFSAGAVFTGYRVFRTDSMMRAAFYLLASFAAVGGILVLLGAEFLGMLVILMMAGEMLIMAIVMIMYMMNPAGLNPMWMVHQHRASAVAGIVSFLAIASTAFIVDWPDSPNPRPAEATAELGTELLGSSMLPFETAGIALLGAMVGAIALASRGGRFGDAEGGSQEPVIEVADAPSASAPEPPPAEDEQHVH
jgi:NADH-quinone oxidoreductase subunit J